MVSRVINLPDANSNLLIECVPLDNGDYRVQNSRGTEICTINGNDRESMARDIASMVPKVRDLGFEQGRMYIVRALGLTK